LEKDAPQYEEGPVTRAEKAEKRIEELEVELKNLRYLLEE
jgi:hypothetical protein